MDRIRPIKVQPVARRVPAGVAVSGRSSTRKSRRNKESRTSGRISASAGPRRTSASSARTCTPSIVGACSVRLYNIRTTRERIAVPRFSTSFAQCSTSDLVAQGQSEKSSPNSPKNGISGPTHHAWLKVTIGRRAGRSRRVSHNPLSRPSRFTDQPQMGQLIRRSQHRRRRAGSDGETPMCMATCS